MNWREERHEYDVNNLFHENLHHLNHSFHLHHVKILNDLYVLHFALLQFDKAKVRKMVKIQHLEEDKKVSFRVLDKERLNEKNQDRNHVVADNLLMEVYYSSCWIVKGVF